MTIGRLSLQAGMPVPQLEYPQNNPATSVYWEYSAAGGNFMPCWNGSSWTYSPIAPKTLSLSGTPGGMHDVKADSSGNLFIGPGFNAQGLRSEVIQKVQGVWCDSGHNVILGTVQTFNTGVSQWTRRPAWASGGGAASLGLSNVLNRMPVDVRVQSLDSTWNYASGTPRYVQGGIGFTIYFISPLGDTYSRAKYRSSFSGGNAATAATVGAQLNYLPSFPGGENALGQVASNSNSVGGEVTGESFTWGSGDGIQTIGGNAWRAFEVTDSTGGTFYGQEFSTLEGTFLI